MKVFGRIARIVSVICVLAIALCLFTGCGTAESSGGDGVTVTDMAGREVVLKENIRRIVVLQASDCELIYALGAGEMVVGRGQYCDYPAQVLEVDEVQSGGETNIEQIIALEPDVVIMTKMSQTIEQEDQLGNAGIPVIVTDAQDIEGIYESIELLGKVVGREAEAAVQVSGMKEKIASLKATASDSLVGKSVYFEVSPITYGAPWTTGSATFMQEVAEILGLSNIFGDLSGWAEVSQEDIIARNPDYIVTTTMYFGEELKPDEEIMARSGWAGITAVKNGDVFHDADNLLSRPTPRITDAIDAFYAFINRAQ